MKRLMVANATVVAYPYNGTSAQQEQWGLTMGRIAVLAQEGVVSFLIRYFNKLPNDKCVLKGAPWATLHKLDHIPIENITHVDGNGIVITARNIVDVHTSSTTFVNIIEARKAMRPNKRGRDNND